MFYCSIDIETTGLDKQNDQILSFGAIIEDTNNIKPIEELPQIHFAILRENISGSMFAINLNRKLIENIVRYQCAKTTEEKELISKETNTVYITEDQLSIMFHKFLWKNNIRFDTEKNDKYISKDISGGPIPLISSNMPLIHLNVAGKNFADFDKHFIERLPRWKQFFKIRSRILDPGVLFLDWFNDESVPSLDKCKERANIQGFVTHNALEDAIDVLMLLRTQYEL